jgi:serine/threonine-protein kinase
MADVRAALIDAQRADGQTRTGRSSIAVLPFANLSPDRDNEYFSDGLAEEIINALAQVSGLKVIARTSAFAFKGQNTDVRRIADTLGVTHVLEGSVRKAGNRIRVTAQLITASDGSHEWSERFDRDLEDVFAIQDEIAGAIARTLRTKLLPQTSTRRYTPALPAYEEFLRGRHHVFQFTPEGSRRGRQAFARAIELDPQFARPHAELGLAYLLSVTNGYQSMGDVAAKIREAADTALALDPSEPAPHSLHGARAAACDYDWAKSAHHFRLALETTLAASDVHWAYGSFYLQALGRFGESVAEMQREVQLDPLNISWRAVLAAHLNHAERYDEAIAQATTALTLNDDHWVPAMILAQSYGGVGRWQDALATAERAYQRCPWNGLAAGVLAGAAARAGRRDRAEEVLRAMGEHPRPLFGRVEYHLWCEEIDAAADWYARAIEARDPFCVVFAHAPLGRPLRASARWPPLARAMNLPEL